jgi:hypothetical protein
MTSDSLFRDAFPLTFISKPRPAPCGHSAQILTEAIITELYQCFFVQSIDYYLSVIEGEQQISSYYGKKVLFLIPDLPVYGHAFCICRKSIQSMSGGAFFYI